jgi:hypothetical protein
MEAEEGEIPQPKENPYEAFGDWIRENPGERLGKAMALSDYGAELAVKLILDDEEVKANDQHQYDEAETRLAVIEEGARAHGVFFLVMMKHVWTCLTGCQV